VLARLIDPIDLAGCASGPLPRLTDSVGGQDFGQLVSVVSGLAGSSTAQAQSVETGVGGGGIQVKGAFARTRGFDQTGLL